jgi:hypothetical protein
LFIWVGLLKINIVYVWGWGKIGKVHQVQISKTFGFCCCSCGCCSSLISIRDFKKKKFGTTFYSLQKNDGFILVFA